MSECTLWCDNVWTWREYVIVFVPIFFVVVFSFVNVYTDDGNTIGVAVLGLIIGLVISGIIVFVPYIFIFVMAFFLCVIVGWILAKLAKMVLGE